jgi:hypothetical protein
VEGLDARLTAAIEFERALESDALFCRMRLGVRLLCGIQAVDVRLVVLRVM